MSLTKKQRRTAAAKDFRRTILHSKGRFASILLLMSFGSFALVGLFVSGPDMRQTAIDYFNSYALADLSVISDYGLTEDDVSAIDNVSGASSIEYGYFKDVTIDDTGDALRVMSEAKDISVCELIEGRLPLAQDEIAIDTALEDTYAIGDVIKVSEKADAVSGTTTLTRLSFTVVGYINSPEVISFLSRGQSTAGAGSLAAYGIVSDAVFDSEVYMVARIVFEDTAGLDPYTAAYRDAVQVHKEELEELLADRPQERLDEVKSDAQEEIDEAVSEVEDAQSELDDARTQLEDAYAELMDAEAQIADAKATLSSSKKSGQAELSSAKAQLDSAASALASAKSQLDAAAAQIASGQSQLDAGYAEAASSETELEAAKAELAAKKDELDSSQAAYDAALAAYTAYWDELSTFAAQKDSLEAQLSDGWAAYNEFSSTIETSEAKLKTLEALGRLSEEELADAKAELEAAKAELAAKKEELDRSQAAYDAALAAYTAYWDDLSAFAAQKDSLEAQLSDGWAAYNEASSTIEASEVQLEIAKATLDAKAQELEVARGSYNSSLASYNANYAEYQSGLASYRDAKAAYDSQVAEAESQIADAQKELDEGWETYTDSRSEYEEALPEAESQIADALDEIAAAQDRVDRLAMPSYEVDTRREALTADAYTTYETISEIIDSLAKVFPVLLYVVAAFVTLSTVTRMVEEERLIAGTYKALGYSDLSIAKKYLLYGALAGGIGAVLGIAAGHTLMPWVIYKAYAPSVALPAIELLFYPKVSAVALLLAALCSVLPAWIAVKSEMAEKPARLLQHKAPKGGSRIFLEKISPLWKRLSFNHKVTARNLFRYKQRMFMTVLGVAGAACMLVAGFGVQQSISQMGSRQFGDILAYDMIVARVSSASEEDTAAATALLETTEVKDYSPLYYETVSQTGGDKNDRQDITLIVSENDTTLREFVSLRERKTGRELELADEGAIISERLSTLMGLTVGDSFEFTAADGSARTVIIAGICEMYMGHFMFMSASAYEEVYGSKYATNAHFVSLYDSSEENVKAVSAEFMSLAAVKSVVQNTNLQTKINTVVKALDKIMTILIFTAGLLAVVIMYNLTNLNVSERMRELSTIKVLGFHTSETTMYIYRETIILTALGLLCGFGLGVALHEYILVVVPPDNVMFDPSLCALEFWVPAVVVVVITVLLYLVVRRRLGTVDMLEALKCNE